MFQVVVKAYLQNRI